MPEATPFMLEVLGSGGAVTTPKPFCACPVCLKARNGSAEHSRWGPSVFIHGPDILIDTPEEIKLQLLRSTATRIRAGFYSHWHPDHTAGKRVFDMYKDWIGLPPRNRSTDIYLPETVAATFGTYMGIMDHFRFLEYQEVVKLHIIGDAATVDLDGWQISPLQLAQGFSFGYIIRGQGKSLLVIMDELKGWIPSETLRAERFDLVYLPLGILDVNPLNGQRQIAAEHPILEDDQTVEETLALVRSLNSRAFVLSHLEEPDGIGLELAAELSSYYSRREGQNISLAWDTRQIMV